MIASKLPKWNRYEWDARFTAETYMSETRGLLLRLIWVRRLNQILQWYDWDAKLTVDTNMTETPWPNLAQIWLRRPKIFWSLFLSVSQSQVCRIEKREQNFFGRLSHICATLGQGVSIILLSTVILAYQSYHCKLWFKRLNHISLSSKPRVSLISVSFGSFWRSHIRHPPKILSKSIFDNLFCV